MIVRIVPERNPDGWFVAFVPNKYLNEIKKKGTKGTFEGRELLAWGCKGHRKIYKEDYYNLSIDFPPSCN